ncbi:hypothetical protein [Campylobacter hyointestinalis]|uniref:Uncharacterized protein n=1 Tax=Campylobacter hyointestinalis subsp. hyointestinalis TaxID=91352 RepID=A0A9W5AWW7_CAMHY|nr:hypothetical protein [Campylobacter hyointestinalis]PPB65652.1 hypothetical protein CDQ75_08660 [Campylobacter hyointestinalis subsp. hyointestinalis]CUU92467.1 Uncharacterised protein [Campylobacter hyointestinalis subsp. hyointestinalis]
MNTNLQQTIQALDVAHNAITELEKALNAKLNDELSELINTKNDMLKINVSRNDNECEDELKITLCHNYYQGVRQRLEIACDFAKLEIITTTQDALKIKKLIEFCEKNILG